MTGVRNGNNYQVWKVTAFGGNVKYIFFFKYAVSVTLQDRPKEQGNLVFRHSVPNKTLPLLTFRGILMALHVEWHNFSCRRGQSRPGTQSCDFKQIVGSIPTRENDIFIIFIFLALVPKQKYDVKFHHPTGNATRIRLKL